MSSRINRPHTDPDLGVSFQRKVRDLYNELQKETVSIWITGKLEVVQKDHRVVRLLKTLVGIFKDPYAHIRIDRVAQEFLAYYQKNSKWVTNETKFHATEIVGIFKNRSKKYTEVLDDVTQKIKTLHSIPQTSPEKSIEMPAPLSFQVQMSQELKLALDKFNQAKEKLKNLNQ